MSKHYATITAAAQPYRVYFGDELIVETSRVLEVQEHFGDRAFPIVAYFAPEVAEGLSLEAGEHESSCPLKGVASYFGFRGERDAVWTYREPKAAVAAIANHLGFDTSKGFRVEAVATTTD